MDPRLAEIYGNGAEDSQDQEKIATAQLAEKLAADDSVNLDGMSPDELEALAQEVLASGAEEKTETEEQKTEEVAEETEETQDKEASEKLAEADYLGRVMAHSYVKELREIEKTAGKMDKLKSMAQSAGKKAKGMASEGSDRVKGAIAMNKTVGKGVDMAKKHPGKAKGLAALGVAGAGFAAGRKSKKSSVNETSALDTLASQRALEILAENGIDLNEETEEKTASPADVLAAAVQARAVELLKEEGYEFEESEEETEAAE